MPEEKPKHYRILSLKASNIKRIKAIEILPNGNIVTIGGKNDQGKTSILDAIQYACAGGTTICEQPIRHGATKADIVVDLGDMVITKTFATSSSPTLKIKMKDGSPVKSPQGILDALCSKISYDPMELLRMKPDKQVEMLRQLTGLDFTALNADRQKTYDERTVTNRNMDQKKAKLATMPEHPDAPASEVSVKELMDKLSAIRTGNQANQKVRDAAINANNVVLDFDKRITDQEEKIQELLETAKNLQKVLEDSKTARMNFVFKASEAKKTADAIQDSDEQPITDQITSADDTNSKVRDNASRKTLDAEITVLAKTAATQTTAIENIDADKEKLLKAAKFPLPGLTFDDSGVLLDGVPFEQAGMAAKMKASVAIGLALNPRLRVILVRDGSLLDDDSMDTLKKIAEEQDAQIWIEVCHGLDKASVVIEDGMILEK